MNHVVRRINKMEHRFGTARDAPSYVLIMTDRDLTTEEESYIELLDESGGFTANVSLALTSR